MRQSAPKCKNGTKWKKCQHTHHSVAAANLFRHVSVLSVSKRTEAKDSESGLVSLLFPPVSLFWLLLRLTRTEDSRTTKRRQVEPQKKETRDAEKKITRRLKKNIGKSLGSDCWLPRSGGEKREPVAVLCHLWFASWLRSFFSSGLSLHKRERAEEEDGIGQFVPPPYAIYITCGCCS